MSDSNTRLVGKAPLTMVRTLDGKVHYVYRGKPAPTNISADERKRLVGREFLAEVEAIAEQPTGEASSKGAKKAAKKAAAENSGSSSAGFDFSQGIDKVKAYVGDDAAKANAVLDFEQAKPMDQQRTSLIPWLEKVANPGE